MLIAAIGDIHGCRVELDLLLEKVVKWFDGRDGTIVFLGDYVDRGPEAREVLDRLRDWDIANIEPIYLLGNHEEMMIQAVLYDDASMEHVWLGNGGRQTAFSLSTEIEDYCRWLEANCVLTHATPGLLFVHAGVNPDRELTDQRPEDYLWIRDKFLRNPRDYGVKIVHGHTPVDKPEIKENRINLDTGCVYSGGSLTAGLFENDALVRVISVPRRA